MARADAKLSPPGDMLYRGCPYCGRVFTVSAGADPVFCTHDGYLAYMVLRLPDPRRQERMVPLDVRVAES